VVAGENGMLFDTAKELLHCFMVRYMPTRALD
jgi:hypothetical protein